MCASQYVIESGEFLFIFKYITYVMVLLIFQGCSVVDFIISIFLFPSAFCLIFCYVWLLLVFKSCFRCGM